MYTRITKCRACGHQSFVPVLDLGMQALTGVFPKSKSDPVEKAPLQLVRCGKCELAQLHHTVPPTLMFGKGYGYRSSLNRSMVSHLESSARAIEHMVAIKDTDVVVDIGSNDGTTLKAFRNGERWGFDPGDFQKYYDGTEIHFVNDYFKKGMCPKAKVITAYAMFYDLDDPISFLSDMADTLAPGGVIVLELAYLPTIVKNTAYDTICHEHLCYYRIFDVETMAIKVGLRRKFAMLNDTNGGSAFIVLEKGVPINSRSLQDYHLYLDSFATRVRERKEQLLKFLDAHRGKVVGYGASTKGNVLLQYCGITEELLPAIVDVNPDKWGSFTPGSLIPIVPEGTIESEYFLVMPWHFKDDILKRNPKQKFVFPLPTLATYRA